MIGKNISCGYFTLFIVICYCYQFNNAQKIMVYSESFSQGKNAEVSISECTNLPDEMAGEVTSINTKNTCARFYDAKDCTGRFIEVMPRSPWHSHLHFWGFNNKTVSVGPCPDMCDTSITGDAPDVNEMLDLVIYSRKMFKGAYQELKVQGCTLIPPKFTHQLQSANVYGKCLQFYNNIDCKHSGPKVDSIELRRGTPSHYDISAWLFPEAKAVSHCSYKCNDTVKEWFAKAKSGQTIEPSQPNEVILFDAKNYQGNSKSFVIESCTDIIDDWEGNAVSIKTLDNSCISVFKKRGCSGDSLKIVGSNPDLAVSSFDAVTRSIQPCTNQ